MIAGVKLNQIIMIKTNLHEKYNPNDRVIVKF